MKALLTDNDGTLVDTESVTVPHLLSRILDVTGGAVDVGLDEFFKSYHGLGGRPLIEAISRAYGRPIDHDAIYGNRLTEVEMLLQDARVPAAPNAAASLRAFADNGWEVAIVSNESARRGVTALSGTPDGSGKEILRIARQRYFEAGDRRKPDPEVYLRAAAEIGVDPARCIAVEDSPAGVQSAVAAGITCYGYLGLVRPGLKDRTRDHLLDRGAVAVVEDWSEIVSLVGLDQVPREHPDHRPQP